MSVLLIHHAGRSDNARGTSKREDILDTIVHLKRPADYAPDQGARFEVHLTKARGVFGDEARPFEARMEIRNGATVWTTRDLVDVEADQVATMTAEGPPPESSSCPLPPRRMLPPSPPSLRDSGTLAGLGRPILTP